MPMNLNAFTTGKGPDAGLCQIAFKEDACIQTLHIGSSCQGYGPDKSGKGSLESTSNDNT